MIAELYTRFTRQPALKPFFDRAWQVKTALLERIRVHWPDAATSRFIAHNEKRFPPRPQATGIVLVGQFHWNPSLYLYSLVANDVATRTHSRLEAFDFSERRDLLAERLYASFGAPRGLHWGSARRFRVEADQRAETIFAGLRSKWDVLLIRVGDITVGDLIYDTYLRFHTAATVDLRDHRLRELIREAVLITLVAQDYFARHEVRGVFPDHTVYIKCGILVRVAFANKVPVYILPYNPHFYVLQLDPSLSEGMTNVTKRWSYYKYHAIFAGLPAEQQSSGRATARAALEERLSGKIDTRVLVGRSAYGAASGERLLGASGKPKVLILLHDFCDSVHCFREMLFPDFYEWAHHLLARASETDFEWYMKPHPNSLTSEAKNVTNAATIAALQAKFPKITLLDATVSNRQLVDEGISAVFTVHGTAGHELAYLGVPVVNAGDNLHIAYRFNFNPKTVEKYDALIASAGALPRDQISQDDVAEFYYMHYFFFHERNVSGVNPIDEEWRTAPDFFVRSRKSEALDYFLRTETPEKRAHLQEYLDGFFNRPAPTLGGAQWATIGTG